MDAAPKLELVERELSLEERRSFIALWNTVALSHTKPPEKSEDFSNEQLKAWMYDSLIHEMLPLIQKWKIVPDIAAFRSQREGLLSPDAQAQLEFVFIKTISANLCVHVRSTLENPKPHRWESWPRAMEESDSANCLGATLVGVAALESAGIDVQVMTPFGHSVVLATLSNGDHLYADLINKVIIKIEPRVEVREGIPVMIVDDPRIEYSLMPVHDKEFVAESVLGNLIGVAHAASRGTHANAVEEARTLALYQRDSELFDKTNLEDIWRALYGPRAGYWWNATEEKFDEHLRVSLAHDFLDALGELPEGQRSALRQGISKNIDEFILFMKNPDSPVPAWVADETKPALLEIRRRGYESVDGKAELLAPALEWFKRHIEDQKQRASTAS